MWCTLKAGCSKRPFVDNRRIKIINQAHMRTACDRVHINHAKRSIHYIKGRGGGGGGIMDDYSDYAELFC